MEFLSPEAPEDETSCFFAPRKRGGDEISEAELSRLPVEEQERFHESDAKEWGTITGYKAVTVIPPREARQVIQDTPPSRILRSRMVRRWKPGEGVGAPAAAKSRWVVLGFECEEDAYEDNYAPTPTNGYHARLHPAGRESPP